MAKKNTFTFLKYGRFALVLGLMLGLMLVVTACGGDDDVAKPAAKKAQPKVASQSEVVKTEKKEVKPLKPEAKEEPATAKKEEAKPARVMGGDVPRNKTLVVMPWSDTLGNQLPMPDTYNPYQNGVNHQRHAGEKGMIEFLFYTNLNVGSIIPWIGKKWTYNATLDSVDVELRDGVKWSDGTPFTSNDVKHTIDMVTAAAPDVRYSQNFKDKIASVDVKDDLNFTVNLTKPDPRYFQNVFGLGHENHQDILPKHVWESEDVKTFKNLDIANGHPVFTGAYQLVQMSAESHKYDLRDDWWGTETGFWPEDPHVERVLYIPASDDEVAAALYINNEADAGPPLLVGTFKAAMKRNPALQSWGEGPVFGAPDGCTFNMEINHEVEPYGNVDVRWALNHTLNRTQISALGYEGAVPPVSGPFSSYAVNNYIKHFQPLIDKHGGTDPHDLAKAAERMEKAGYAKNADGIWEKGGEIFSIKFEVAGWLRPNGPVVEKQLRDGGFDATYVQSEQAVMVDNMLTGNTPIGIFIMCGSINEPYDTLKQYHKKHYAPLGEKAPNAVNATRWQHDRFSEIIDKLEGMAHSMDDAEYMSLTEEAMDIWYTEMPAILIAEELHVVVQNGHFWSGWASRDDPYVAPYPCWNGWYMQTLKLRSTGN